MIFENGTIYKGGVRIGEGDILIGDNGFHETVLWSGLTIVSTTMRRGLSLKGVTEKYDLISLYSEDNLKKIDEFMQTIKMEKTDKGYNREGNGNIFSIEFYYPTLESPNGGRFVKFYIGNSDKTEVKFNKEFTYMALENNELNFYYGRYFKLVKGMSITNENGKLGINHFSI